MAAINDLALGNRLLFIFLALTPAIVFAAYFAALSRAPARWSFWSTAFFAGCATPFAIVPIALVAPAAGGTAAGIGEAFMQALFIAALPEEAVKMAALMLIALRHYDARMSGDAIAAGALVGLGFAATENLFYVFGEGNGSTIAIMRAVSAVPAHALFGAIMGGLIMLARRRKDSSYTFAAYCVPVFIHTMYNFPLLSMGSESSVTIASGLFLSTLFLVNFGLLLYFGFFVARDHLLTKPMRRDAVGHSLRGQMWRVMAGAAVFAAPLLTAVVFAILRADGPAALFLGAPMAIGMGLCCIAFAGAAWRLPLR